MSKRGSYNGGSSIIKTKHWLAIGSRPRAGRVGLLSEGLDDPSVFVGATYVVRADEAKEARQNKKRLSTKSRPKIKKQTQKLVFSNKKSISGIFSDGQVTTRRRRKEIIVKVEVKRSSPKE